MLKSGTVRAEFWCDPTWRFNPNTAQWEPSPPMQQFSIHGSGLNGDWRIPLPTWLEYLGWLPETKHDAPALHMSLQGTGRSVLFFSKRFCLGILSRNQPLQNGSGLDQTDNICYQKLSQLSKSIIACRSELWLGHLNTLVCYDIILCSYIDPNKSFSAPNRFS